jgi:HAE1 family hydrophobic/amphiphilic exporter-1
MMSSSVSGADTANFDVELHEIPQGDKLMARLHLRRLGSRTTDQVVQDFNKQFGHVPGVKINAALKSNMGGGSGGAPITIQVSGLDEARSLKVAARILGIVQRTEGTYGGELSWRQGRPELQAVPDDARASQYGINSATIASALRTSLEGDASVKYRENGREYDIRVSLPESQRDRTAQVPEMVVGTSSTGRPVYLADVTKLTPSVGPTKVERINRQRAVTVNAYLKDGFSLGNLRSQIDAARVSDIGADEMSGVTVEWAGTAQTMDESFGSMGAALLLAVILVFMLMSALFESVLSPLIIMLSVPQAMAGALLLMAFTGGTLSIVTMIGIIMLIGLVTKNAILMVDYTNTLRKEEGLSRGDALRKAGPTRLRPILMTTMAMIFGMLPTAIALSNGSEMRQPMAVAVIGGLTLSMFLTLLMVPVFYEIVDEFGAAIGRGIRSITGLFNK